jgi:ribosomal protein S18 acetylase RimI-like enzyme
MCRFSWQETGGYLVSIAIDAHFRGEGFGHQLLTLAIQSLSDAKPGPVNIVAQVKKDNKASCKLFLGANFESVANDNDALVFSKIIN